MKLPNTSYRAILVAMLALALPLLAVAEPMSYTGNQDIGELMDRAEDAWDLEDQDAVLLLEGYWESVLEDGRVKQYWHRIVWISTDYAIETFADLRVPYDAQRQELNVKTLRTWRDSRWIDARETAVVETTPYALGHAPAYTNIRETMLLHDGVELPCIMEVAYEIVDKEPYRDGSEGMWLFQKNFPAVNSVLVLDAPQGSDLKIVASPGVPQPEKTLFGKSFEGKEFYAYWMEMLEPAPMPETSDPADYLPHASWSTFADWEELGTALAAPFEGDLSVAGALSDTLEVIEEANGTPLLRAKAIAQFVGRSTKYVSYPSHWFRYDHTAPLEVFNQGYAHRHDRRTLAAALFQAAGLEIWPVRVGKGYGDVDEGVATLARMGQPALWVSGRGVEAYYDPASSSLHNGLTPIYGKSIWLPGTDDEPVIRWRGEGEPSEVQLRMDLSYDEEANSWQVDGYYQATSGLCPYGDMEGGNDQSRGTLENVASGVLMGLDVESFSPMNFDRFTVEANFNGTVALAAEDRFGRHPLVVGSPGHGLLAAMPSDVVLHDGQRGTPVSLPGVMRQVVELHLEPGTLELTHSPEPVVISNELGSVTVELEEVAGKTVYRRVTEINSSRVPARQWPMLRDLLLGETARQHKLMLFVK